MATVNPPGRANYEPNSWGADSAGPGKIGRLHQHSDGRDRPQAPTAGGDFADHYSQARQFLVSQTPIERAHIVTPSCSS